ncbi:MAG: hypothetical protein EG822_09460 [Deltaproteobacteria bacterium]|nr:hypothetical protein [Deltaproteobacteria bacterium]TLN02872.1 MAG: hypothetical protein FDZ73_09825 [bacterium]
MFRWRRLLTLLPALATLAVLLTGNSQAALLDVGPVVPEVVGSSEPNIGHGYPLWYRDTNRVPLQLCLDTANGMCLLEQPNPLAPLSFPDNIGPELFYFLGGSIIDYPQLGALTRAGAAELGMAIEAAYAGAGAAPGDQISFARVRIRIDTPFVGEYLVTTPYGQFTFDVDAATLAATEGRRAINFTSDIGIGETGVFTGALAGQVGPFLYCTNAPIVLPEGSYIGNPGINCPVLGSTFNPPGLPGPANYFRVQGPNGFDVQTDQFAISGKLYTDPIATPITVDKATYSRNSLGLQHSTFATTQAMSNQTNPALPFPENFALTNVPSALTVSGISDLALATNNPEDGKFFGASGVVADPGTLPANITVTNTVDIPPTAQQAPLVDEIVISEAVYNPSTGILRVAAVSGDSVTIPTLQLFFPGENLPAGTLASGQISVQLPLDIGGKNYVIPPPTVIVNSSLGGSESAPVQISMPSPVAPSTGVSLAATVTSPQAVNSPITFVAAGAGGTGSYEYRFWLNSGSGYAIAQDYSTANSWTWTPAVAGAYDILVDVRTEGSAELRDASSAINFFQITATSTPATGVAVVSDVASPQTVNAPITFTATGSGGSGTYEYRFWINSGAGFLIAREYSADNTFVWTPTTAGNYDIMVDVRNAGSTALREAFEKIFFYQIQSAPATAVSVTPDSASPQAPGTPIVFTAAGSGGSGNYEYRFWLNSGSGYTIVQNYSTLPTWTWIPSSVGNYDVLVDVRSVGSTAVRDASNNVFFYQIQ